MPTTKIKPQSINDNVESTGLSRQALINGNFDVWQRGTSLVLTAATVQYVADRYGDYGAADGGTLPTLTRSRQIITSGAIDGAYYNTRLAFNGAGTSLGVSSFHKSWQTIEHGVRKLCGASKKVTVSFWARSDVANKRICPTLLQSYGTGGSPSADEKILGTPITLTTSWVKYTATFTTNTLTGKTFGTADNDLLELDIWHMWGTTWGNANVQASVTAETYVGAGYVDIAQVQLCAGDVALPFMPKSYEEELRACQRYYFQVNNPGQHVSTGIGGYCSTTTLTRWHVQPPVTLRTSPVISYSAISHLEHANSQDAAVVLTALAVDGYSGNVFSIVGTVASGLTIYRVSSMCFSQVLGTGWVGFSAEL